MVICFHPSTSFKEKENFPSSDGIHYSLLFFDRYLETGAFYLLKFYRIKMF